MPRYLLLAYLLLCTVGGAVFGSPFSINGTLPRRAVATAPWASLPDGNVPDSPMLRTLTGVAGALTARDLRDLDRAVARQTRVPPDAAIAEPLWTIHLSGPDDVIEVRIGRVDEGWLLAEGAEGRARLEERVVARLSSDWAPLRPDPSVVAAATVSVRAGDPDDAESTPRGVLTPRPVASGIRLDAVTLATRFARGGPVPFRDPLTRSIDRESFTLSVPGDAPGNRPMGLLVWINPTESGEPPSELNEAADALSLAIITPEHAGNDRPVVDRLQVALDAVQTASGSVWIDPDRVYIAGMSGGGRLSSMLWAGAPDVFTGAVGVVGLNSHHQVPTGKGTVWPASHRLPAGDLSRALRPHPIAAISGPRDFNFTECRLRINQLRREGFAARLFDVPRLGHVMPDAAIMTDALTWIDRPVHEARAEAAARAQRVLDRIDPDVLENPEAMLNERDRRALERVTLLAPWTDPAWRAATRLGYAVSAPGAP